MASPSSKSLMLVQHLIKTFAFRKSRPDVDLEQGTLVHLDLTSLKLALGPFTPILLAADVPTEADYEWFNTLLEGIELVGSGEVIIIVCASTLPQPTPDELERYRLRQIAIIDGSGIESILRESDPNSKIRRLVRLIGRFVGRQALSPYIANIPAYGGRFFGREQLLKQMLETNANYLITGSRRIGKTSLLRQLRYLFSTRSSQTHFAEVYGATCLTVQDVIYAIVQQLSDRTSLAMQITSDTAHVSRRFINFVRATQSVVFIDELDQILEWDAETQFQLLHTLRAAFETSKSRIFFTGFRYSARAVQSQATPLFNFTQTVSLAPLDRFETKQMVVRPLSLLGIDLTRSEIPDVVYDNANGYPELVQLCCSLILDFVSEQKRLPSAVEFLQELNTKSLYRQRALGAFMLSVDTLEQLVCYLLIERMMEQSADASQFVFDITEVDQLLRYRAGCDLDTSTVYEVLDSLELLGITARIKTSNKYRLAFPALGRFLGDQLPFFIEKVKVDVLARMGIQPRRAPGSRAASRRDAVRAVRKDQKLSLFISYNKEDLDWAEWIAWALESAGYQVVFQNWDFVVGSNFVSEIQKALQKTDKTVLVLSENYLKSAFAGAEWTASLRDDPMAAKRRLIPIRVRECQPSGLLGTIVYLDLVGQSEQTARRLLLSSVQARRKPLTEPQFPTAKPVRFPGEH